MTDKAEYIKICTSENVVFTYKLAEMGVRIAAYLVDFLVIIFIQLVIIGVVTGFSFDVKFSNFAYSFLIFSFFIIRWFYFIFLELYFNGASIGKLTFKLRVIKKDGEFLDIYSIILRNFIRNIEGFTLFPIFGGFIALIDKYNRRLGDIVAGTYVVYLNVFELKQPEFYTKFEYIDNDYNYAKNHSNKSDNKYNNNFANINEKFVLKKRLSEDQLYVIRKFLNNATYMHTVKKIRLAKKLAKKVELALDIKNNEEGPVIFLEKVYKMHETDY